MRPRTAPLAALVLCLLSRPSGAAPAHLAPRAERAQALAALLDKARTEHTTAPVSDYLERLKVERDPLLHKFGVAALLRQKTPMTGAQKRYLIALARQPGRGLLPERPLLPKTG